MDFRLCPAATAIIPAAISTMSATAAVGGVAPRAIATSPTPGVCIMTRAPTTTTTTIRATCTVFVVCRTEGALTRPPLAARQAVLLEAVSVY